MRPTFPINHPVRSRSPTISVYKEREVSVMEKKFAIEPLDRDRDDVLASDEIEGSVGVIQKRLGLQGLEAYHFEAS